MQQDFPSPLKRNPDTEAEGPLGRYTIFLFFGVPRISHITHPACVTLALHPRANAHFLVAFKEWQVGPSVIIGAFFSDLHTSLQLNKKKDMQPAKGYVHLFFALAVQA